MKKKTNRARAAALAARTRRRSGHMPLPNGAVIIPATDSDRWSAQVEINSQLLQLIRNCANETDATRAGLAATLERVKLLEQPATVEAIKAGLDRMLREFDEIAEWRGKISSWAEEVNRNAGNVTGDTVKLERECRGLDKTIDNVSKRLDRLQSVVDGTALRAAESALVEFRAGMVRAAGSADRELTPEQSGRLGRAVAGDEDIPF